MQFGYNERLLLAMYLEFLNRCYDTSDERKYNVGPETSTKEILVRHVEMQNITYLLDCLHVHVDSDYGFCWNWKGPYSGALQTTLRKLDEKGSAIEGFYDKYNNARNKYYVGYQSQLQALLSDLLPKCYINIIADASFILEDVLRQDGGSEIVGGITYIGTTVHPGQDITAIINELNARGLYPSPELVNEVWRDLALLGIRTKDSKEFTRERKLINNNGMIL